MPNRQQIQEALESITKQDKATAWDNLKDINFHESEGVNIKIN